MITLFKEEVVVGVKELWKVGQREKEGEEGQGLKELWSGVHLSIEKKNRKPIFQ